MVDARPEQIELAPAPDGGSLTVEVECRPTPRARKGTLHDVTIHPDWTVTMPHDVEAERVAAAFGGYTSCLTLIDETIPAFRAALALLRRRIRPALRRDARGAWRVSLDEQVRGCCSGTAFATVEKAVRHLRSLPHLVGVHRVPAWQLGQVLDGAQRAWGSWEGMRRPRPEVTALVREVGGVAELWRCGIRPDEVVELAAHAEAVQEPLPIAYFIGLTYGNADPEWVGTVVRHRPDPDVAAWLANLEVDHSTGDAQTWGRWLGLGLPRDDVITLVGSAVDPTVVDQIVSVTRWSAYRVGRSLAAWARVGAEPGPAEFEVLARHRIAEVRLSSEVIDQIQDEVGSLVRTTRWHPVALTRTEVGVMFAVLGNRNAVLHAVHSGVRGVEGLDHFMDERDSA